MGGPDGVLLLDKPPGYSSTQALARVKRALGARRAGHTGTLDPFATGLLPIALGEGTKFSRFLIDSDKAYDATIRLGHTSTTGDIEGVISGGKSSFLPTLEEIGSVIPEFRGPISQVPPMHSALRVGGQRLYDLARAGVELPRQPRSVIIKSLEIVNYVGENLQISVKCSKGTYIRVLAEDIGSRLGCGGYLVALRRTGSGPFSINRAVTLDDLQAQGAELLPACIQPVEALVGELPRVELGLGAAQSLMHGQHPPARPDAPAGEAAMFGSHGNFLGVARAEGGRWVPVRLMGTGSVDP